MTLLNRCGMAPMILSLLALVLSLGMIWGDVTPALGLTEEETKRAEALIPLLDGRQEFWAIGELVHLGAPAIPVLANALSHPSRRVRINAIEAMSLIKDKAALSVLNSVAANPEEIPAVREKALRVAIRLDPASAMPALQAMAKDRNEGIRHTVVSESRQIKDKAVIDLLIGLLADDARSVADGALRTLYGLTGRFVERQDFLQSTKEQRIAWSRDWAQWWDENRDTFNLPTEKPRRPGS